MIYNKKILKFIEIINLVLLECNQEKLLDNKDFLIPEGYLNLSDYLVIDLVKKDSFKLRFWFENNNLRIDIDGIEEAYVFNYTNMQNNQQEIQNLIKIILTSILKIESCADTYKKLFFIKPNDKEVLITNIRHSILSLLGIKWKCHIREYLPIYGCPTQSLTTPKP